MLPMVSPVVFPLAFALKGKIPFLYAIFLVSNSLIQSIKDIKINKYPRGKEKPSDHTPIELVMY